MSALSLIYYFTVSVGCLAIGYGWIPWAKKRITSSVESDRRMKFLCKWVGFCSLALLLLNLLWNL